MRSIKTDTLSRYRKLQPAIITPRFITLSYEMKVQAMRHRVHSVTELGVNTNKLIS